MRPVVAGLTARAKCSRALGSVKFRAGGDSPRPGHLGGRLTRWNSWTDGQSPDGKRTRRRGAHDLCVRRRRLPRTRPPRRTTQGRDGRTRSRRWSGFSEGRAGSDAARPGHRHDSRCPARAQPEGRLRAARRRRSAPSPRATTAAPAAPTPRSRHWRHWAAGRPRGSPRWSPSSPATTPAERGRARGRLPRRASRASCTRWTTRPPRQRGVRRRCEPRASRSPAVWRPRRPPAREPVMDIHGLEHGRPFVTWKFAASLDGRSAAADGTSRWVSNPALTCETPTCRRAESRRADGGHRHRARRRPLAHREGRRRRAATRETCSPCVWSLGEARRCPCSARVLDHRRGDVGPPAHRDLAAVLDELFGRGRRHVFVEGGPTPGGRASCVSGLVDEVVAYVAPLLVGGGVPRRRGPPRSAPWPRRSGSTSSTSHRWASRPGPTCASSCDPAEPMTPRRSPDVHRHRRGARRHRVHRGPGPKALRLTVRGPQVVADAAPGDSIAVDGLLPHRRPAATGRRSPPTS